MKTRAQKDISFIADLIRWAIALFLLYWGIKIGFVVLIVLGAALTG